MQRRPCSPRRQRPPVGSCAGTGRAVARRFDRCVTGRRRAAHTRTEDSRPRSALRPRYSCSCRSGSSRWSWWCFSSRPEPLLHAETRRHPAAAPRRARSEPGFRPPGGTGLGRGVHRHRNRRPRARRGRVSRRPVVREAAGSGMCAARRAIRDGCAVTDACASRDGPPGVQGTASRWRVSCLPATSRHAPDGARIPRISRPASCALRTWGVLRRRSGSDRARDGRDHRTGRTDVTPLDRAPHRSRGSAQPRGGADPGGAQGARCDAAPPTDPAPVPSRGAQRSRTGRRGSSRHTPIASSMKWTAHVLTVW